MIHELPEGHRTCSFSYGTSLCDKPAVARLGNKPICKEHLVYAASMKEEDYIHPFAPTSPSDKRKGALGGCKSVRRLSISDT